MYNKEEYIKNKIKRSYQERIKKEYINNKIKKVYQEKYKQVKINENIKKSYQEINEKDILKNKINKIYQDDYIIERQIDIYRELAKNDIIYRIINNISSRINSELKKRNIERKLSYIKYLGCTPEFLKKHLEEKFIDNMSYNNYGKWEVDHIYPISKIDFTDEKQIIKHFNYTNLQPLWLSENRKKHNKIITY